LVCRSLLVVAVGNVIASNNFSPSLRSAVDRQKVPGLKSMAVCVDLVLDGIKGHDGFHRTY